MIASHVFPTARLSVGGTTAVLDAELPEAVRSGPRARAIHVQSLHRDVAADSLEGNARKLEAIKGFVGRTFMPPFPNKHGRETLLELCGTHFSVLEGISD